MPGRMGMAPRMGMPGPMGMQPRMGMSPRFGPGARMGAPTGRREDQSEIARLLEGSSIRMGGEAAGGTFAFWSDTSRSSFSGREDVLSLGGDVRTTMFGADYQRGRMITGVSVARSAGEGPLQRTRGRPPAGGAHRRVPLDRLPGVRPRRRRLRVALNADADLGYGPATRRTVRRHAERGGSATPNTAAGTGRATRQRAVVGRQPTQEAKSPDDGVATSEDLAMTERSEGRAGLRE